jgi:hypothetical protein
VSEFDVRGAVQFFGGPAKLARLSKANGKTLSIKAIEKWGERKRIPFSWVCHMAKIARAEGRLFDMTDFIPGFAEIPTPGKKRKKRAAVDHQAPKMNPEVTNAPSGPWSDPVAIEYAKELA